MNWFRNFNMRAKILSLIFLMAAMMAIISWIGWSFNVSSGEALDDTYTNMLRPVLWLTDCRNQSRALQADLLALMLTTNEEENVKLKKDIELRKSNLATLFSEYENIDLDPFETERIPTLKKVMADYMKAIENPMSLALQNKNQEAYQDYSINVLDLGDDYTAKLGELADYNVKIAGETNEQNKADTVLANRLMLYVPLGAILLSFIIGYIVAVMIAKPIKGVADILKRQGELDLTLNQSDSWLFDYAKGRDEIGVMVRGLNALQTNVGGAIRAVMEGSSGFKSSAERLSEISKKTVDSMNTVKDSLDRISSLMESNSAALEEVNAGVEEVAGSASSSAKTSTDGASASAKTSSISEDAADKVGKMIGNINKAAEKSRESTVKTQSLSESVAGISAFVSTITSIADQTNLLALNAAIEAARAGDAGRGFAVVADEVRKLAEESNRAAREIGQIILGLQEHAQGSIKVTEEAGEIMKVVLKSAAEAESRLKEALLETSRLNDVMQSIAAISQEQAASSEEMASSVDQATKGVVESVEAISQIKGAADETEADAAASSREAESLLGEADRIMGLVSRFKISSENKGIQIRKN